MHYEPGLTDQEIRDLGLDEEPGKARKESSHRPRFIVRRRANPEPDVIKGEVVKRRTTDLEVPGRVFIPESFKDIKRDLEDYGKLQTMSKWAWAAYIHACCEPQKGRRLSGATLAETVQGRRLTFDEFAKFKIRGLSSRHTVSHYYYAWEKAIKKGWVKKSERGAWAILPGKPFPRVIGGEGDVSDPEARRAAVAQRDNWHISYLERRFNDLPRHQKDRIRNLVNGR